MASVHLGVDGSRVERVLELCHIACNKNTVPGDKSAMVPGGLRLGTPALTTRGFVEADFEKVADMVVKGIEITKKLKAGEGRGGGVGGSSTSVDDPPHDGHQPPASTLGTHEVGKLFFYNHCSLQNHRFKSGALPFRRHTP